MSSREQRMGRKRPDREFQARIAARADELRAADPEYCNAGPGPRRPLQAVTNWLPILWAISMVLAGWFGYNLQRLACFVRGLVSR